MSTKRLITLDKYADPRHLEKKAIFGPTKRFLFGTNFDDMDEDTRNFVSRNVFATGAQRSDDVGREALRKAVEEANLINGSNPNLLTEQQKRVLDFDKSNWFSKMFRQNPMDPNDRVGPLNLLIGRKDAGDVTKARFLQGGVFGKGGLISGDILPPEHILKRAKEYWWDNLKDIPSKGLKGFTSKGMAGLSQGALDLYSSTYAPVSQAYYNYYKPLSLAYKAFAGNEENRKENAGRLIGRVASNALLNQYGVLPNMIGGQLAESIGGWIGSKFDTKKSPNYPSLPPYQTMADTAGNFLKYEYPQRIPRFYPSYGIQAGYGNSYPDYYQQQAAYSPRGYY